MGTTERESTSFLSRFLLVVFCLVAGLSYRVSVSVVPPGVAESLFLLVLAALLLVLALVARKSRRLQKYWEIPFAFFIFTVAGFFGDVGVSPLQHWFVGSLLRESPGVHNPLASSTWGMVAAQLFSTAVLVLPILLLSRASGSPLSSVSIGKETN